MSSRSAQTLDDISLTFEGKPSQAKAGSVDDGPAKPTASTGFDPKLLLNPKGTLKHAQNADALSTDAKDGDKTISVGGVGPGVGSLIEKMHNIGKREDEPRKRPKTSHVPDDEGEEHDKNKKHSTSHGGNGGGVISDYVKTKREQGLNKAGPSAGIVDLTNGIHGQAHQIPEIVAC